MAEAPDPSLAGNDLKNHSSPYLALHGDDPVNWRDWGEPVLSEAKRLNRPIFISSGYFSCHWCHVMQRESYKNLAIAKRLNEHFIAVKLDRELHPAVDDHLIRFVERTRGQAGWPLNVFLSPDGYPMAGLTYLPPAEFSSVLDRVIDQWKDRSQALSELARDASSSYAKKAAERISDKRWQGARDPAVLVSSIRLTALDLADDLLGGFGNQNKFPMEPQLLALLELQERHPDDGLATFLTTTLSNMADRGLRDHLAGGFFRYTVDPDWRTPHFEKMLYNQAQMAQVYLTGARVLKEPAFNEVARETLDFVLDDLDAGNGSYIASLSAVDEAGEEGGSYLWSQDSLSKTLTRQEVRIATAWWSLNDAASTAIGWLPQRLITPEQAAETAGVSSRDLSAKLPVIEKKLLDERQSRLPPRDHKQLAAWNGLLLWALADADAVFDGRYEQAGESLARFLMGLWDGGRLYRARDGIRILGEASLEDYAYVAAGMAAWGRHSGHRDYPKFAVDLTDAAWRLFYKETGWSMDSASLLPGMPRDGAMSDGALPAPSAVLMRVTASLDQDQPKMTEALEISISEVSRDAFWHASHAMALLDSGQMTGDEG